MPHCVSPRDEKLPNISDMSSDFGSLRISALQKASKISGCVDKVTIGPDSTIANDSSWCENLENEKNSSNTEASKDSTRASLKNSSASSRSAIELSKKKILVENETQRRHEVWKAMERRRRDMERDNKVLREKLATMQETLALKREREESEELARLEAEEERLAQQNEMRRKHQQQLQSQRIQERREKLERDAEEQRKIRQRDEIVSRIAPLGSCFREKLRDVDSLSTACKDRNSAASALAPLAEKLRELNQQMEAINERTRAGDISTTDINIAENVVRQSEDILNLCKSEIARIDSLYEEEIARREYEMRQAEAQSQAKIVASVESNNALQHQLVQEQISQAPETLSGHNPDAVTVHPAAQCVAVLPATPPDESNANNPESVASATDSTYAEVATDEADATSNDYRSLQIYMSIDEFLKNYAASYRDLTQATAMKKFRFECQKAINIPVNAISGISGTHVKDKYETLRSLLMGASSPNVTQHPQGVSFCKDVLAKKIVSQGETLISSKPEMAFPVAAIVVALWNDYPDFGELLLAHFRRTCPYIIPIFPPRLEGQTNEEYYKSLGYKYTEDGAVEKQDKYLTRMSGLMRLYASIIVSKQRRGLNAPHPHGIQNAWRWLAATLNAEPRMDLSDVCATLILDMLEVAGNSLWQTYPKQFPKMLLLLVTQYYPRMQSCGGIGGGPLARLEQFLKDCINKKTIPPPEGTLAPNFW